MNLSETQQKIAAVTGLYDMFLKGDMSKIKSSLSSNYEQFPPQKPGLEPGLDNFMQAFMEGFGSSFSEIQGETTHVLVDGDYVFVRGEYTMVHSGEAFGLPATGQRISFSAFDLHRIEDGLIVQTWHLEDFMAIYNQIKEATG